jgi:hypothetical protein
MLGSRKQSIFSTVVECEAGDIFNFDAVDLNLK